MSLFNWQEYHIGEGRLLSDSLKLYPSVLVPLIISPVVIIVPAGRAETAPAVRPLLRPRHDVAIGRPTAERGDFQDGRRILGQAKVVIELVA